MHINLLIFLMALHHILLLIKHKLNNQIFNFTFNFFDNKSKKK